MAVESQGNIFRTRLEDAPKRRIEFMAVAPQRGHWTAFWYSSSLVALRVFRECSFSGILFEGGDNGTRRVWSYMIWREGTIANWFVSDVETEFETWGPVTTEDVLHPFIEYCVGQPVGLTSARLLATEYEELFQADISLLSQLCHKSVDEADILFWLSLDSYHALQQLVTIFDLPLRWASLSLCRYTDNADAARETHQSTHSQCSCERR